MAQEPHELIHLAYGNPPTLCGLPNVADRVLYVATLWHAVPKGLKCPTCDELHADNGLHGFN
jgi:hypothetical protein